MIRTVALLLPALLLATPAAAQSEVDSAQARVKTLLEAVRLPVLIGDKPVPGVFSRYTVGAEGCVTTIDITTPAFTDGERFPERLDRHVIDWQTVEKVSQEGDRVRILGPGLPDEGLELRAGSVAVAEKVDLYFYHGVHRKCDPRFADRRGSGPADW